MMRYLIFLLVFCCLPFATMAQQPILQLNTGGHQALIRDLTFTPDGYYLISGSDDKLVYVWDIKQNKLARTFRGQIGVGDEGKIYALALSPDGNWLAVGGWMQDNSIRLYDFNTGKLVGLLHGHDDVINALAFSHDGKQLISGGSDSIAIIWNLSNLPTLPNADNGDLVYLKGHTGHIYAVAFTLDNQRAVTGSLDHDMRLWDAQNGTLLASQAHSAEVRAVEVAPRSGVIASGDIDGNIRLWSHKSGKLLKQLALQDSQVGDLAFSPDGQYLLSSCGGGSPCLSEPEQVYRVRDGKVITTYDAHDNIVLATAISSDGRLAATGGGKSNEIHLWDLHSGEHQHTFSGVGTATWAVGWSPDGQWLAWGYRDGGSDIDSPLEYQVHLPDGQQGLGLPLKLKPETVEGYRRAETVYGEWSLQHRAGGEYGDDDAVLDLWHKEEVITSIERGSNDGYGHTTYTFTPDGKTIVSAGANGVLSAYDLQGELIGEFVGHTDDVWSVAINAEGDLLASASSDQTVRVWQIQTQENLLTLFYGHNGEWIAWTPQGYYTAAEGGENLVGWHINRGTDVNADYITAAQLRAQFHRPDIIDQTLILGSAERAIAQASNTDIDLAKLIDAQPLPQFILVQPRPDSRVRVEQQTLVLDFGEHMPMLEKVMIYRNGELVDEQQYSGDNPPTPTDVTRLSYPIKLESGSNEIRVVVSNMGGEYSQNIRVVLQPE